MENENNSTNNSQFCTFRTRNFQIVSILSLYRWINSITFISAGFSEAYIFYNSISSTNIFQYDQYKRSIHSLINPKSINHFVAGSQNLKCWWQNNMIPKQFYFPRYCEYWFETLNETKTDCKALDLTLLLTPHPPIPSEIIAISGLGCIDNGLYWWESVSHSISVGIEVKHKKCRIKVRWVCRSTMKLVTYKVT